MADSIGSNGSRVAGHFGRQMQRDRLAKGWTINELAEHTGIHAAHLSRVERALRPPTARVAYAMDQVFSERNGWYSLWLDDIRTAPEIPATFKSWSDFENSTKMLRIWTPSIFEGLLQTEEYARAQIATEPGLDDAARELRLAARMARQKRVLSRRSPPLMTAVVDEAALYRRIGSAETMARQMRHLLEVARTPNVTLQAMPEIEHASLAAGYLIADDAVWSEHVITGGVYTDAETVAATAVRFATLHGECYKVSESLTLLASMEEAWSGGSRPIRRVAEGRASK